MELPATGLRWRTVTLLCAGMIIAQLHRVDLSIAMPVMAGAFGWSDGRQGFALSAFYATYTVFLIPAGLTVDRFGVRGPYLFGLLIWSFASAATGLVNSLGALIAARLVIGMAESVVTPASMRYIRNHFREEERGFAVGVFLMGTKVGPAIGMPLSAYLIAHFGWRSAFVLIGVVGVLWAGPWLLLFPRRISTPEQPDETGRIGIGALRDLFANRATWGILLGTFCYMYFLTYCLTWLPSYFGRVHGMSITETGWYSGAAFGGMAASALLAGWLADQIIRRGWNAVKVRKGFVISGLVLGASQTLGAFTDSVPVTLFLTVFAMCGLGLVTPNYWALTHTLLPRESIATAVGMQNAVGHLAHVISPWLTGRIIEQTGSFDAPIMMIGFWLTLGIVAYGFLVPERADRGSS